MRASNLTIAIPDKGCNLVCPYCISNMTPYPMPNAPLFLRHLPKARYMATQAGVTSVLVTGKGEPTMDMMTIDTVAGCFSGIPLELQTNGMFPPHYVTALRAMGFNVLAVSLDRPPSPDRKVFHVIEQAVEERMVVRLCYNVTPELFFSERYETKGDMAVWLDSLFVTHRNLGIKQILFRRVTVPELIAKGDKAHATKEWIEKNIPTDLYHRLSEGFDLVMDDQDRKLIRTLPHGAEVYEVDGMGVSFSDYCVQEHSSDDDIRSLIYQQDGHMYTCWSKAGSILF